MSKRLTTKEFISRAKEVHGDKYDYSKVEYKNNRTKVCIICPEHGEFWQSMSNHVNNKQGCPFCGGTAKLTTEEFISRAKKIHGDKYDYSKVNYINKDEKVCIICPKHGEFWQSPHAHVNNKQGCPKCGGTAKLTTEEFISKAKKIYGDKYDYSKVDYKDSHTKVCIICPKHGEFWQRPNDHLSGYECPKCSSPHLENEMRRYLNLNNIQFEEQKTWEWLLYKGKQRVDFYLPEYNIVIECQGIQHFVDKEFFNKEISFEERKLMDKNKKDLCELHGIKIFYYSNLNIEYPYKVYKDIETLINEIKTNLTN